ncbi:M48 family metalloprotease, partial [Klebsiella pneumoniae]
FFLFANLPEFFYTQSGLEGVNAGVFALLLIFGSIFTSLVSPLLNLLSRKNEFAADLHGAKLSSKEDMKNALIALAKENKAFVKTSKIYTIFHLSHPSISERLKALS